MKKLIVLALVLLNGLGTQNLLFGCSGKLISISRGARFQQAPSGKQERILIYTNPASDVPAAFTRVSVETTLRRAGYAPRTVNSAADFERELRTAKWDLVVVGRTDAEAATLLKGSAKVLLVALQITGNDLKQARKQYSFVLTKAAPNSASLVRTIGDALNT